MEAGGVGEETGNEGVEDGAGGTQTTTPDKAEADGAVIDDQGSSDPPVAE